MEKTKSNWKSNSFLKLLYVIGMCLMGALFVMEINGLAIARNYRNNVEMAGNRNALKNFSIAYSDLETELDNDLENILTENSRDYKSEHIFNPRHKDFKNLDVSFSYYDEGKHAWVETKSIKTGNTGSTLYNKTFEKTLYFQDGRLVATKKGDSIDYYGDDYNPGENSEDSLEEDKARRNEINEKIEKNEYSEVKIKVNGIVYSNMKNRDKISYYETLFRKFVNKDTNHILKGIGYFAGVMVLFVLSIISAGYKRGEDKIHINWFDRIPFILLFIPFGLLGVAFNSFDLLDNYSVFITPELPLPVAATIFIMMTVCLYILACTLSFARRLKAGRFFESTCLYWIVKGMEGIEHQLKEIGALDEVSKYTIFTSCIWLVLMIISISRKWYILMVILSLIIVAAIISAALSLKKIEKAGKEIASGNLDVEIKESRFEPAPFREYIRTLNSIKYGMEDAVKREMKSERMKTELITNVSHDIKTPLTNIISYVDLLKKAETEEERSEYLEILGRQSERLKKLTLDLIEASKASTGNVRINPQPLNLSEMLDQSVGEYEDKFNEAGLTPVTEVKNPPVTITADGRLLFRVISNLLSNVCKYSMHGTRVYIDAAKINDTEAEIVIKNISERPLNITADELMERFVRGDESRSSEGSGLGLDIAKSLTELMGGTFSISIDGDTFKVSVILPIEK